MKAVDTSVVVAAFASWHEQHDPARQALDDGVHLIAHCALEAYSVLTRLPPPHRARGELVRDFLASCFPDPWLQPSESCYRQFVMQLPELAVRGGAAYDALIATTAVEAGATLVSCDRRAQLTYARYGLAVEFFGL